MKIAVVTLENKSLETVAQTETDAGGRFILGVPPGRYALVSEPVVEDPATAPPITFEAIDQPLTVDVAYRPRPRPRT